MCLHQHLFFLLPLLFLLLPTHKCTHALQTHSERRQAFVPASPAVIVVVVVSGSGAIATTWSLSRLPHVSAFAVKRPTAAKAEREYRTNERRHQPRHVISGTEGECVRLGVRVCACEQGAEAAGAAAEKVFA